MRAHTRTRSIAFDGWYRLLKNTVFSETQRDWKLGPESSGGRHRVCVFQLLNRSPRPARVPAGGSGLAAALSIQRDREACPVVSSHHNLTELQITNVGFLFLVFDLLLICSKHNKFSSIWIQYPLRFFPLSAFFLPPHGIFSQTRVAPGLCLLGPPRRDQGWCFMMDGGSWEGLGT